ncbi:MAG: 2-dehydropantoate 2-reductase [Planctomycetota bacterium]
MRVVVQGPGAIGSWLAARLTLSAAVTDSVLLLDRSDARAARLTAQGIMVEPTASNSESGGEATVVPVTVSGPAGLSDFGSVAVGSGKSEFWMVCVKHGDLEDAIAAGRAWVSPEAQLLVLTNGLGHDRWLGESWPADQVWLGTTTYGVLSEAEGRVRPMGFGAIRLGPLRTLSDSKDESLALAAMLRNAELTVETVDDVDALLWEKAIVNCAINPVAALTRTTNGALRDSAAYEVTRALVRETVDVFTAHRRERGATPPAPTDWIEVVDEVCRRTATNRCSMLRDLERGRKTEIDALNLAVASRAEELGLPAPLNRALGALVRAAEASPTETKPPAA